MRASFRRYQDDGWFSTSYCLDAQIFPTPEETKLIEQHGLEQTVIFDSENVEYYAKATEESAGAIGYTKMTKEGIGHDEPFFNILGSFFTSVYHLGATAYNAAMWSFSATITVQSLIDGTRIDGSSFEEVIRAENLIRAAVEKLKAVIIELSHFDGSESHHEL